MRAGRSLAMIVLALLFAARPGHAQELRQSGAPIGVRLNLIHDDYDVVGGSAQGILDQLEANGWTRYSLLYTYRWTNEVVRLTNGMRSDKCRPHDFEFLFDVTARYPRWDRSPDASPELVAAWEAFAAEVEAQWEQYRDDIVGRARAAVRRLRRFEETCAFVNERVQEQVRDAFEERDPITAQEPRLGVQWPPDGHVDVMRNERAANRAAAQAETAPAGGPVSATATAPTNAESRALPPVRPAVTPAPTIDLAVSTDLRDGATGLVVDLHHLGRPQFTEAFGSTEPEGDEELSPEEAFDFPGLTEVFVATITRVLAASDYLDLEAPIGTWLPELSPRLRERTLGQLLDHRAGIDNAMAPDSVAWDEVMGELNDRAVFTAADALFSYSRYSYPLVVRVLEAATGQSLDRVAEEMLFAPLGMDATGFGSRDDPAARDGLPLVRTTVADVERFWSAWLDEAFPEAGPGRLATLRPDPMAMDGRTFTDGYWFDRIGEAPRISLLCAAPAIGHSAGVQVFPDTRTIMSFWARYDLAEPDGAYPPASASRWPKESVRFVLAAIAGALDLTDEVYRPTALSGGGQPGRSPRICAEPAVSQRRVESFGPRTPAGDWPGRYVNGEWFFALVETDDGTLGSPVDPARTPYSVRHYGGNVYFTNMDLDGGPDVGFALRLVRDEAGRRYVMLGDRAYLHEDDRPPR